ncbi:hypothetical protein B0H17DRAFT_1185946 [Mycena rosella]|uniref:Uncharacterized protein n=1 Tax=Mycena rosella TaxID=1033263 RepID=A0AAD7CPF0_MYCRO|nr:hypothetical protein B0H17DRAFT_1185946 [Mycena rosella]
MQLSLESGRGNAVELLEQARKASEQNWLPGARRGCTAKRSGTYILVLKRTIQDRIILRSRLDKWARHGGVDSHTDTYTVTEAYRCYASTRKGGNEKRLKGDDQSVLGESNPCPAHTKTRKENIYRCYALSECHGKKEQFSLQISPEGIEPPPGTYLDEDMIMDGARYTVGECDGKKELCGLQIGRGGVEPPPGTYLDEDLIMDGARYALSECHGKKEQFSLQIGPEGIEPPPGTDIY